MHKIKIAILIGQLVFGSLDARVTRHNLSLGGRELNPMVRPVAHSNAIYFDFAGESVAQFLIGAKLEKSHPKISKFFFGYQITDLSTHAEGYLQSSGYIFTQNRYPSTQNVTKTPGNFSLQNVTFLPIRPVTKLPKM